MTELTFREVQELIARLGGEQGVREFLSGKTKTPIFKILVGLKSSGEYTVGPLTNIFAPKYFFRDDRAVNLSSFERFKNRVLSLAGKVSKQPAAKLVSYDLTKPMYDSEIRAELPENHVFALDDLWMIADLIRDDKLLKNGRANLFYFQVSASVLVVCVFWDGSRWIIRDWALDEDGQCVGRSRVFSLNG